MKRMMLLYPKPVRALRTVLRDGGWDWRHSGVWVVDTDPSTVFTIDLDGAALTVWPEGATVGVYGLFAAVGERLYARCDFNQDGVLTAAHDLRVTAIRPCRRVDPLDVAPPALVRWRANRAASRLPPPWRLGPAPRD